MKRDAFSTYHPAVTFMFFIAAIGFGMCFIHPAFLICSCVMSAAYLFTLRGMRAAKTLCGLLAVMIIIALINPLFNTEEGHALLMLPGGHQYTLESLCRGVAAGAVLVTVILWFAACNTVMTSDKFMYLFGGMTPSISLTLTMILRLIPAFQKKARSISGARKCIGKAGNADRKAAAVNGMLVTSALTGWALEGGIVTADSMQSRGYGCGRRTRFSIYRFDMRDKVLLAVMAALTLVILVCALKGGMRAVYVPSADISGIDDPFTAAGLASYAILLAIPSLLDILEEIIWRRLRSEI